MTWAKVDDQFHAHRKAKRAWKAHPRALGLHLLAMSYCAGQLTDGLVDDEFVEEKLPANAERRRVTDALVSSGLWMREDDGWRIHDWLKYNPSRAETLERRRVDAERKARGRGTQARGQADDTKESERTPLGVDEESDGPVPSRPVHTESVCDAGASTATDPLDTITDERLTETVTVLRECDRLTFDLELLAVAGTLTAHPNGDHLKAARLAVVNATNPNYRTTDAGKALWHAFDELDRNAPKPRFAPKPVREAKPWDGAIRAALDERKDHAA